MFKLMGKKKTQHFTLKKVNWTYDISQVSVVYRTCAKPLLNTHAYASSRDRGLFWPEISSTMRALMSQASNNQNMMCRFILCFAWSFQFYIEEIDLIINYDGGKLFTLEVIHLTWPKILAACNFLLHYS